MRRFCEVQGHPGGGGEHPQNAKRKKTLTAQRPHRQSAACFSVQPAAGGCPHAPAMAPARRSGSSARPAHHWRGDRAQGGHLVRCGGCGTVPFVLSRLVGPRANLKSRDKFLLKHEEREHTRARIPGGDRGRRWVHNNCAAVATRVRHG